MFYRDYYKKKSKPKQVSTASRKSYGNTWWGAQWLNALNQIDYSNRLPRGKTYANNGYVGDLKIVGNSITASVEGSQPRPYKVKIEVPKFTDEAQNRLLHLVTDNPLFLSKLLNRELPQELNQACLEAGVYIFPHSWDDLKGSCSCPDWAVPCKHMAAVLYLVANEIDKNPFTVFDLHAFDLVRALEASGYTKGAKEDVSVLNFDKLCQPAKPETGHFQWDDVASKALDFSILPANVSENLLRLLSEKPVFYPEGDFKKLVSTTYSMVKKGAETKKTVPEAPKAFLFKTEHILLVQSRETGKFWGAICSNEQEEQLHDCSSLADFVALFEDLLPVDLPRCSPTVKAVHLLFLFARHLAIRGAFVPQILKIGEGSGYQIRYVPALLNESVRTVFEDIKKLIPKGILTYSTEQGGVEEPTDSDYLTALLALFLGHFVAQIHVKLLNDSSLTRWFFSGETLPFNTFESREYPKIVHLWLSRFFIAEKSFVPVFNVSDDAEGRFEVSVSIEDKAAKLTAPAPLADVFSLKKYAHLRLDVLRDLSMVTEFFAPLAPHINSKGVKPMRFSAEEFVPVFFEALPVIRLFGIKVLLPKSLQKLLRPAASLRLKSKGKIAGTGLLSFAAMIDFNWQIALGGQVLDPSEFEKMVRKLRGIVKLADGYAYLDEGEIKNLLQKIETAKQPSPMQLMQIALVGDYNGAPIVMDESLRTLIDELLRPGSVALPEGLQANLRPYQLRGYEWLYKNTRLGFGSLIADDMGLGKTLQVIATLQRLKEENALGRDSKALVVVPTTLLTNWQKEMAKFAPGLLPHIYHGQNRSLDGLKEADILLTTYGILRSDLEKINKKDWAIAIIDEAQNIKNLETAQTKAVKKIKSPLRIAMTGTPVENRLSEYYSIFDFSNHGWLGTLKEFSETYAKPIELERSREVAQRFQKITAPFLLRRVKTDKSIINDLPDKIEINQACSLTTEQAALYENVVQTSLKAIETGAEEGIQRQGLVLKMLTSLKQVCNHPAHFLKQKEADPALSGKTQLLLDLLEQIAETGEKTLIFTQYREMGDLLIPLLSEKLGIEAAFLHGGCSRKQRDEMVEHFQNHHAAKVLLLSLKAGGTGLNLTAASNVVHYDLWWNPAVEAQATDRAYRIGQHRNVQVHRFLTQGTLEEKIDRMLQSKKELANLTVGSGEKWIGELNNSELRELVKLG